MTRICFLLFALILVCILVPITSCNSGGGGGGDEDDDPAETVCGNIAECGFGDQLNIDDMDDCLDLIESLDEDINDCAEGADDCDELAECFGVDPDVGQWLTLFEDGFESDNLNSIWEREDLPNGRNAELAHSGSLSFSTELEDSGTMETKAHFDLTYCSEARLKVWVRFTKYGINKLRIAFTVLGDVDEDTKKFDETDTWYEATYDLSSYCGWASDMYFSLDKYYDESGYYVDDFKLEMKKIAEE
jgi:hypothetical protein